MKQLDNIHVDDYYKNKVLTKVKNKNRFQWTMQKSLISFATVMLVVFLSFQTFQERTLPVNAIVSSVAMDINPSIILNLDSENIVREVVAMNEDAQSILSGIEILDVGLEEAMNKIIDSPQYQSYLENDFLEVSIYSENPELVISIDEQVNVVLNNKVKNGNCRSQYVDKEIWNQAKNKQMSVGKYKLIQDIEELENSKNLYEDINLEKCSMKELRNIYNECTNGEYKHGQGMKESNGKGNQYRHGKEK